MNAHGTNTAREHQARPRSPAPDTCSIALIVASRGASPCSMWCSTASTTTMASSTTMPIASTRPNSVRLLRLKPMRRHDGERADDRHRHGDQRNQRRPPVLQEQQHDDGHQDDGVAQRLEDLVDRLVDERRRVVDDGVVDALGEALLQLLHLARGPARPSPARWSRAAGRPPARPTACRRACRSGRSPGRPVRCRPTSLQADDAALRRRS